VSFVSLSIKLARAAGLGVFTLFGASLGCALFIGLDAGESDASGTSGPDGGGGCAAREDCPANEACAGWACEGGKCVTKPAEDGTPVLAGAAPGDCRREVCEGGSPVTSPDDTDVPQGGDSCSERTCASGEIVATPVADGTPCGPGEMGLCYEDGVCASGACALTPKLAGVYVGDDAMPGNCMGLICDGKGAAVPGTHDEDVPVDNEAGDCKKPVCSNGSVEDTNIVNGSACSAKGGVKCCAGECCPTSHTCAETGECCPEPQRCLNGTCCPTGKTCSVLNICG
jgi:hypothetical protein